MIEKVDWGFVCKGGVLFWDGVRLLMVLRRWDMCTKVLN